MRIRWRGLELPSRVVCDESASTPTYGRFVIEPFERGFGTTVGNSLRRILLSSIEGACVSSVKIPGADHEFCALPGVLEDVTDIILNIKSLTLRLDSDEPKTMTVSRNTKGEVRAGDIQADAAVTIVNPDQLLATLTDDVEFSIEMTVEKGRGYLASEERRAVEQEIGVIPIDAVFSPVTRVRYKTEETRVGQRVNYDRLVMEVWTKGTVGPEEALVEAAKILRKHLNPFVQYYDLGSDMVQERTLRQVVPEPTLDTDLQDNLDMPVSELELSVRAGNCLESAKIKTVGELVRMTEPELLRVRSFGKTSLREVKRRLADLGLSLGLDPDELTSGALSAATDAEDTLDEQYTPMLQPPDLLAPPLRPGVGDLLLPPLIEPSPLPLPPDDSSLMPPPETESDPPMMPPENPLDAIEGEPPSGPTNQAVEFTTPNQNENPL